MTTDKTIRPFETVVPIVGKTPRYYQSNAANAAADYLEEGFRRIIVKGPTGCGKTLMSKLVATSTRVRDAVGLPHDQKIRVLYIANKHRLNRQAVEEYADVSDSVELIPQSAFAAIPQSVIDEGWDMTFVDECHHEAMHSIQNLLTELIDKPLIGFTADDERGDGLLLKFDRVVTAITEREAAEQGFIEKAGINTFIDTGKRDKTDYACSILDKYHEHMGNTIIFLKTEAEARAVYRHVRYKLGASAALLDSSCGEQDMDRQLDRLSEGKIQFLVNCQRIGEGVDTKNVTDVLLFRRFQSRPEKKQFIGRAIRPDSPCAVWEMINPFEEAVDAVHVVGATKYRRLINFRKGVFTERLLSGEDATWGQMSGLRVKPEPKPATTRELIEKSETPTAKPAAPAAAPVAVAPTAAATIATPAATQTTDEDVPAMAAQKVKDTIKPAPDTSDAGTTTQFDLF